MSVINELLTLIQRVTEAFDVPRVRSVYIPEPRPHENRHTEFGVVELEDGASGLYYAWLGDTQQGMSRRFKPDDFPGTSPIQLLPLLQSHDDADRSLGMAALNAVTYSFFRRAKFSPDTAGDSLGSLGAGGNDHIGMVGYFPSLIARLRERNVRITVVEKKPRFADSGDELVTVTGTPESLHNCNKILITASTLLNDSLDDILVHCSQAETVVMIGPTAGFPPDPLFHRNVTALGGTEVLDASVTISDLKTDAGISCSTRKYLITRNDYPGIDELLRRVK